MARKSTEELKKHTLNLRAGDIDTLAQLFPRQNPSVIVRLLVSKYVDAQLAAVAPPALARATSQTMESLDE